MTPRRERRKPGDAPAAPSGGGTAGELAEPPGEPGPGTYEVEALLALDQSWAGWVDGLLADTLSSGSFVRFDLPVLW